MSEIRINCPGADRIKDLRVVDGLGCLVPEALVTGRTVLKVVIDRCPWLTNYEWCCGISLRKERCPFAPEVRDADCD